MKLEDLEKYEKLVRAIYYPRFFPYNKPLDYVLKMEKAINNSVIYFLKAGVSLQDLEKKLEVIKKKRREEMEKEQKEMEESLKAKNNLGAIGSTLRKEASRPIRKKKFYEVIIDFFS